MFHNRLLQQTPLLTLAILTLAGPLTAQSITYDIDLRGGEESPPVQTSATGTASITLDPATGALGVTGTYNGTTSTVMAAHLHGPARRGANASVLFPLTVTGGTSGTFSGRGMLMPAGVRALQDGLTYINVHTSNNPGGELRGQVDVVPGSGSGTNPPAAAITGNATAGGSLQISCPPSINSSFILIGLPANRLLPLPRAIACASPTILAIDPRIPPILVRGGSTTANIPGSLTDALVGIQCGQIDINRNCIALALGHHVRIAP